MNKVVILTFQTGVGIANLLCDAMMEEGISSDEARSRCFMFDVDGLLTRKRTRTIPHHATDYIRDLEAENDFEKCVKKFKATCLIGKNGLFVCWLSFSKKIIL